MVFALQLVAALPVLANQYSVEYGAQAGYEANDNINLVPEDETSITGGRVAIPITLGTQSERLSAELSNEFVSSRYDDSSYDSDDNYLEGRAAYLFENSELEGYATYSQESTRTTEFLDTGIVGDKATDVDTTGIGGKASHSITEHTGVFASIDYTEVDFQSELYQNYQFTSGSLGWTQRWSERTRLAIQAYGDRFEDEGGSNLALNTDSLGVQFGIDYQVTNRVDAQLLMGWVWMESQYDTAQPDPPEDNNDNALMVTGSLIYLGERYRLHANVLSMPTPSGDGYLRYTRQVDVGYDVNLTERVILGIGFTAGNSEAVDNRIDQNRDYVSAEVGLEYRISPSWTVETSYTYSFQNQAYGSDQSSAHASSNAVYVGLVYKPASKVWSR